MSMANLLHLVVLNTAVSSSPYTYVVPVPFGETPKFTTPPSQSTQNALLQKDELLRARILRRDGQHSRNMKQLSEMLRPRERKKEQDDYTIAMSEVISKVKLRQANTYSGTTLGMKTCPCVAVEARERVLDFGEMNLTIEGATVRYPPLFGAQCQAWDDGHHPHCRGANMSNGFCAQKWCYVDPCECSGVPVPMVSDYMPEATYRGKKLYWSHAACDTDAVVHWASSLGPSGAPCSAHVTEIACSPQHGCLWTGATCASKIFEQECADHPPYGKPQCPCIETDLSDGASHVSFGGQCRAWNNELKLNHCGNAMDRTSRDFCNEPFCAVDPCKCDIHAVPTAFTHGGNSKALYISHSTCGSSYEMPSKCLEPSTKKNSKLCRESPKCTWNGLTGECEVASKTQWLEAVCSRQGQIENMTENSIEDGALTEETEEEAMWRKRVRERKKARERLGVANGCSAPEGIDGASADGSCKEGSTIAPNEWCTPNCIAGRMGYVNVKNVALPSECFSPDDREDADWGGKLCCSGAVLSPQKFQCIEDLFTVMDRDGNGAISSGELKFWHLMGSGRTSEAIELGHTSDEISKKTERLKEALEEHPISKESSDKTSPIVFFYLCAVTVFLMITAAVTLIFTISTIVHRGKA